MKLTNTFLQETYPNMQKIDWRELRFRAPQAEEAIFLSRTLKKKKSFPVLRGTLIKTYSYCAPAWDTVEFLACFTGATSSVPPMYYATVQIGGTNLVTETLCYQKETKRLHPGDPVILVRKSDNTAYTYKFELQ